jgi:hypothetical protein
MSPLGWRNWAASSDWVLASRCGIEYPLILLDGIHPRRVHPRRVRPRPSSPPCPASDVVVAHAAITLAAVAWSQDVRNK